MSMLRLAVILLLNMSAVLDARAEAPKIPDGATPLTEAEIVSLLDGHQSKFTGYDEPITGTSNWNHAKGTVSGTFSWDGAPDAPFEVKWFVKDGKNCTQPKGKDAVCQTIYRTDDGFIEVNKKGEIHAVSVLSR
jgi:hypothetical protein